MMNFVYENYLKNKSIRDSELKRIELIGEEKVWKECWITNELKPSLFISLADEYGFKFEDFLVLNLYKTEMFENLLGKNQEDALKELSNLITLTKKEKDEILGSCEISDSLKKKMYKRLAKCYFAPVSRKVNIESKDKNKSKNKNKNKNKSKNKKESSEIIGKDYILIALKRILETDTSEDDVLKALGISSGAKNASMFARCYFTAIYKDYQQALKAINVFGEIVTSEFKSKIQEFLISELLSFLACFIKKDKFEDLGSDLGIDIIESEKTQIHDEKTFYTNRYVDTVAKSRDLVEVKKNLEKKLEFFKDMYKDKLKNKKILLIGDKYKELEYKSIIDSFGGEMTMYDIKDSSNITDSILNEFNYIFYFTYIGNGLLNEKLKKYEKNVLNINSNSLMEFKKAIISM